MKVPTLAATLALTLALALGYCWHRSEVRRAVEAEAAQRSQDLLVAVVATERAARAAEHTADSLAAQRAIRERDAALRRARATADSLSAVAGRLLDSLRPMLPDTLGPYVDRILAAWAAEQDAWLRERAAADSAMVAEKARIVQLESTYAADISGVNRQVDVCLAQLRAANTRARPGLLARIVRVAPWVAGAFLAGKALR